MFAEFDEGKKGYVTLEDFTSRIAQEVGREIDAARFFEISGATEKGLTYRQFETALTGSSSGRQTGLLQCPMFHEADKEAQDQNRLAAIQTLVHLVEAVTVADTAAFDYRGLLNLAADAIYDRLDRSRTGRVQINDLACYLRGACNYNLSDSQLYSLMGLLD